MTGDSDTSHCSDGKGRTPRKKSRISIGGEEGASRSPSARVMLVASL
jgi:hypothetical protein